MPVVPTSISGIHFPRTASSHTSRASVAATLKAEKDASIIAKKKHSQRYWQEDVDPKYWKVIEPALLFFQALLITGDTFGSVVTLRDLARAALDASFDLIAREMGVDINTIKFEINSDILTTVCLSTSM